MLRLADGLLAGLHAAAALVDALTKYEHTPVLVAGTLRYAIQHWDDGGLVRPAAWLAG